MSDSIWPAGLAKHFLSHLLKTKTRLYYWHKEGHFFLGFVIILKDEIIAQQLLWAVGGEAGASPVKKTWWGTGAWEWGGDGAAGAAVWGPDCARASQRCIPFSSRLRSFPASRSFQMSQFSSGGQRIGASASASVLPMAILKSPPISLALDECFRNVPL